MSDNPSLKLTIISGHDKGKSTEIKSGTTLIGRATDVDFTINDPLLSRHQCKITCAESSITIEDLGSANGTIINGIEITKSPLHPGDKIEIGETTLELQTTTNEQTPHSDIVIDLGLDSNPTSQEKEIKPPSWRPLLWGIGALAILIIAVSLIMRTPPTENKPAIIIPQEPPLLPFEVVYEKIEADTNNVFRYYMTLKSDNRLAIEIDDLSQNRHIRKDAIVPKERILSLSKEINKSGFKHLTDTYEGITKPNLYNSLEITIITDLDAKHVTVQNRVEPEAFRTVRETIETFGKNELGIWAIQFSRDKLVELAEAATTRARNAYEERTIDYGNAYKSLKSYNEAKFYLDTVDPKPEFYGEIIHGIEEATEYLSTEYEQYRFFADRAINLQDWSEAEKNLRVLREMIPDKEDERFKEAGRKLLDIEKRKGKEKK